MTGLWNICTICPSYYWLVSFLICVNYSVGIFISCLMFLCLKCLLTVGEIQYCVYSVGLWFICYASQSFKCSWFSVFFGHMNVLPLVFKLFNQNLIKPYFTLLWFFEIVLACSSVVWEQFLALTNRRPTSPLGTLPYFPITLGGKTVCIDFMVVQGPLDFNLLLGWDYVYIWKL